MSKATVTIREQGGSAIMTIPPMALEALHASIGAKLQLDIADGQFIVRAAAPAKRKRYTLAELLEGVTDESMAKLNEETAWAREGSPVGREL